MTTIKDIARLANCSLSTVSKALNGRRDVSQETKERIIQIAREHNFSPNAFGKGLKNHKTENIGVIFCREFQPLSLNPFYSRVLEGIEGELAINNYNLVLHLLPEVYRGEMPKMIKEHKVDGLILVGVLQEIFIEQLKADSIPTILIDPKISTDRFSQVLIDNEHGGFLATQYLINKGHTQIGFISGDLERESFRQRHTGYYKAMSYSHLPINEKFIRFGGLEMGYDHVSALLKLSPRPTAIFAANDINAIYGYKAVKDNKLNVPDDVSIIGFDDIDLAKMASPPLTTVRVYKEEMGSIAVRKLINLIDKVENIATNIVPVRIIERNSVKSISENMIRFN
ncbi:MAG: LacI family DNA-binding transcriptional regulator [Candidatus Neomarinimicrobiota bacterium]|jgi:LacI family transcriptional regulator|nr:LacI family DNA-binding transcriptional regulator [Candidatus Neomarinimicrobiota bacterium]